MLLMDDEWEEEIHIRGVFFALADLALLRITTVVVPLRLSTTVTLCILDAPHVIAITVRRCWFHTCCLFIFARQFYIFINMLLLKLRA